MPTSLPPVMLPPPSHYQLVSPLKLLVPSPPKRRKEMLSELFVLLVLTTEMPVPERLVNKR